MEFPGFPGFGLLQLQVRIGSKLVDIRSVRRGSGLEGRLGWDGQVAPPESLYISALLRAHVGKCWPVCLRTSGIPELIRARCGRVLAGYPFPWGSRQRGFGK